MSFSSKFRHIYGDSAKGKGQYSDVKNALTSGESQYIKANGKFWAHGRATGGAPIFITKISDVGRQKAGQKYISTHKGRLTDFDFHPFIETLIATGSDDTKVNISKFPSEGLTENITTPEISIAGHKKKISLIRFHPSANNVIASASYDRTVKIWNIENAACLGTMSECKDNIYSMDWNKDGSMLAVTGKDKVLRVYDPRQQDSAIKIEGAFGGIKSSKCFWADSFGFVGSTGFSKGAKRHLKMWDLRGNTEKPIYNLGIDNAASVLIPHMDNDLGILYLAGKGDNSVPRKSGGDVFQEDIYPHCPSTKPALTADEWASGSNADPNTMNMDPDERKEDDGGDVQFSKKATYDEVVAENMELKKLVKQLQDELAEAKQTIAKMNGDETTTTAVTDENEPNEDNQAGDGADE